MANRAGRGTKPGRQEGNEAFHVFRNVRGVAPPLREGLDPVWPGGGVVDRAEHEMKSPEHFVARELGQAFAKRVDKLAARGVEILGDKLVGRPSRGLPPCALFDHRNCSTGTRRRVNGVKTASPDGKTGAGFLGPCRAMTVPRHGFSWERGGFNGALFRGSWRVGYGAI